MNRFHAPEDSVTEQSVRMAHNYEYMVPVEVAWQLEQELNAAREKLRGADKPAAGTKLQQSPLITIAQTARVFAVSIRTIHNWITSGLLNAIKIGGVVRIRRSDVEKLMAGGEQ